MSVKVTVDQAPDGSYSVGMESGDLSLSIRNADVQLNLQPPPVVAPPPVAVDPPAMPPADPPPPPADDPPKIVSQELIPSKYQVMVGETFTVAGHLLYDDGTSKPVTAYALSYDKPLLSNTSYYLPQFTAISAGEAKISNSNSGTTGRTSITIVPNDGTVFPPPPPPPAPAPAPPVGGSPPAPTGPVVPAPSVHAGPVPAGEVGSGAHRVWAEIVDGANRKWTAVGHTGDDRSAAGMPCALVDDAGNPHPRLMAMFYADGCHVHAARMDNGFDEVGCKSLTVVYDGQPVAVPASSYADGTYTFWKGCWMPMIRYGEQEPFNLANFDPSMAPLYAGTSQPEVDASKFDWTWNGVGGTTVIKMGTTGERGEIGFVQAAYMAFWLNPCAATWAMVRKIEDHSGQWDGVFTCEPTTGGIIHYTDYKMATVLPPIQAKAYQRDNPVAAYGGAYNGDTLTPSDGVWQAGGSPFTPNTAHLTDYGCVAAMMTRTAHDKDLLSFWANYCTIDQGPTYTRQQGFVICAQRRFAWAARSMFVACYYSSDADYFNTEFDRNLAIANAWPKNALGILDTYMGYDGKGGAYKFTGMAQWMQNYVAMVLAVVACKRPEWLDFARYVGKLYVTAHSYPFAMCFTVYGLICTDPAGKLLTDFKQIMQLSLENAGWTEEHALAAVNATTVEACYAAVIADSQMGGRPAWPGKCVEGVADYTGYLNSPSSYPAATIAAVESSARVGTPGIGPALHIAHNQPTPIDYSREQKYHFEQQKEAA